MTNRSTLIGMRLNYSFSSLILLACCMLSCIFNKLDNCGKVIPKKHSERPTTLFPVSARGTYILILWLPAPAVLTVGRLGSFLFPACWYAYVGSAFGAGGLRGRLKHHLGHEHRLHWHIDYLAQAASIEEIWYLASEAGYEHRWAALLATLPHTTLSVNRFGASDCKCPSHLFHFPARPSFTQFHALTLEHGAVRCWKVLTTSGLIAAEKERP